MSPERQTNVMCDICGGAHPTAGHSEMPREIMAEQSTDAAHAMALLQNSSLEKLEEAVSADGRSTTDVIRQLNESKQAGDYKTRFGLTEALRQRLDIADMRGEERPKEILDALAAIYARDEYSALRQNSIMGDIPKDNPNLLVHALTDARFSSSDRMLYAIESEDVRKNIYDALKNRNAVDKLVSLVSATKDLSVKINLFEDLASWLAQQTSEEAKKTMGMYGSFNRLRLDVSTDVFKHDQTAFFRLLESGVITVDGLEDRIKDESDETLKRIFLHVISVDDASRVIKFMHSKDAINTAVSELGSAALPPEFRDAVTDRAERLAASFDAPPQIYRLGRLRERDAGTQSYVVPNKFIIALLDGERRATIAWSNTDDFVEHKFLAQRIGGVTSSLCAGGAIELARLDNGTMRVTFEGRSGTFGPYNHAFLEQFKEAVTEQLRRELGTEVEVVIHSSKI